MKKRTILYILVILTSCTKNTDEKSIHNSINAESVKEISIQRVKYTPDTYSWNKSLKTNPERCSGEKEELEFIKLLLDVDLTQIDLSKSRFEFTDMYGTPLQTHLGGFKICNDEVGLIDDIRCDALGITNSDGSVIINRGAILAQYNQVRSILENAGLAKKVISKEVFFESILEQERWQKKHHGQLSILESEWLAEMISVKIAGEFYVCTRLLDLPEIIDGCSDPEDFHISMKSNYGKMVAGYYKSFPVEYRTGYIERYSGSAPITDTITNLLRAHPDVLKKIKDGYLK